MATLVGQTLTNHHNRRNPCAHPEHASPWPPQAQRQQRATLKNDFVELQNVGTGATALSGYSVQ